MKLRETFEGLNTLGRISSGVMAAGALSLAACVCVETFDSISINDHRVNVDDSIVATLGLTGFGEIMIGQQILLAGARRNRSTS